MPADEVWGHRSSGAREQRTGPQIRMTINRYTAATMQQALARVKAALGPEAVILETASAPGEVTVTAAVDRMPAPIGASGELVGEVRPPLGGVRELVHQHWPRARAGLR